MLNSIKNGIRKAGTYLLISSATLGLPALVEFSGLSKTLATKHNEQQRAELVHMLTKPEYAKDRTNIQRNIEFNDRYAALRQTSAQYGFDSFALLAGLAGSTGGIALKRKFDEFWESDDSGRTRVTQ